MEQSKRGLVFGELGAVVKYRRNLKGYSIETAVARANDAAGPLRGKDGDAISDSTWKSIESGRRNPTWQTAMHICRALDVDLDILLEEAVNYRDTVASVVRGDLITYVITRESKDYPLEVLPDGKLDLTAVGLEATRKELLRWGEIRDTDALTFRHATHEEKELWRDYFVKEVNSDRDADGNVGQGFQDMLNYGYRLDEGRFSAE